MTTDPLEHTRFFGLRLMPAAILVSLGLSVLVGGGGFLIVHAIAETRARSEAAEAPGAATPAEAGATAEEPVLPDTTGNDSDSTAVEGSPEGQESIDQRQQGEGGGQP
jgi:hypothetical protein